MRVNNLWKGALNNLNLGIKSITSFKKSKKSAQQMVEFALVLPFFIIIFCYVFQIMVSTFSRYRFTYIFSNAVRNAVQYQPVFTSRENAESYDFRETVQNSLEDALLSVSSAPYTGVKTEIVIGQKTSYIMGQFSYSTKLILGSSLGEGYFYFMLPLSSAFVEPLVLNFTDDSLNLSFGEYYSTNSSNNTEAGDGSL